VAIKKEILDNGGGEKMPYMWIRQMYGAYSDTYEEQDRDGRHSYKSLMVGGSIEMDERLKN